MNITIILPAVQVIRRELDSPQPTTPFPPTSATPSHYAQSPYTTAEFKEILEEHQRHLSGGGNVTQSRSIDIAARQAAYEYGNDEDFESPIQSPKKSFDFNDGSEVEEDPRVSRTSGVGGQITTDSPSSADTVRTVIRNNNGNENTQSHISAGVSTENDAR